MFGPKREVVTGDWRKLHIEELQDFYSSPVIIKVMNPKKIRWVGFVARLGYKRNSCKFSRGNPKERDCLEDISVVGRTVLK